MELEKSLDFGNAEDPCFSHDGFFLASPYLGNSKVVIWETESWKIIDQISCENGPSALRFHLRQALLAAGGRDWVRVWRYQAPAPLPGSRSRISLGDPILELSTSGVVGHIQFSLDGRFVGWSARTGQESVYDATVQVADLSVKGSQLVFTSPKIVAGLFNGFDFLPESHQVLFRHGQFESWDFLTGERQDSFDNFGSWNVVLSPRHSWFVTSNFAGAALFDWRTGSLLARFPPPADDIFCSAWSADGNRLAFTLANGQIQIWDVEGLRRQLDGIGLDWED